MAINQTAFPNIATPKLKKTSINLGGNFGGQSNLGSVSPFQSKVSSASHIKSLKSQRRVLERVIEIEKDVTDLNTRVKMQDESLLGVRQSLDGIRESIGTLQSGQKAIIDNSKEKAKIEAKQRKNEEQRIKRQEAEGSLEKDTGADDIKKTDGSVEAKGKESMGFLEGIKRFFIFTIAGWFTDKSIKLINAFATGNKDLINSIGKKLLGGLAAVGSLMLVAAAGIGPVLAGIGSLIGLIGGLLFNPITLTALLIAVGIGGTLFAMKKVFDWGRNKVTGGQEFTNKHKELDQKLKDAGMSPQGKVGKNTGRGFRKTGERNEEQEKLFQEVQAEREKLKNLKKQQDAEIKELLKDRRSKKKELSAANTSKSSADWSKSLKAFDKETDKLVKGVKEKYSNKVVSGNVSGGGESITPSANAADVTSKIGPEPNPEGNITVVPMPKEQETPTSSTGTSSSVDYIATSNTTNMYVLNSKVQYNTTG